MTHPDGPDDPAGFWQSAMKLPSRIPLRVQLISAVLVLVAVALAVISVAGISYLRSYLLNQTDSQLQGFDAFATHQVQEYLFGQSQQESYHATVEWIPLDGKPRQVVIGANYGNGAQPLPAPDVPTDPAWLAAHANQAVVVRAQSGSGRWLVMVNPRQSLLTADGSTTGVVLAGIDVTSIYATVAKLRDIDLIVSSIALIGLAVIGVAVVRASLRPLAEIEETAQGIAAGDLGRRVPVRDSRTEVGRLGQSLNAMLAQIETAFLARTASEEAARRSEEAARQSEEAARQSAVAAGRSEERMRQFVADASHELRTPLTAIRGFAEYYRQRGGVTARIDDTAPGPGDTESPAAADDAEGTAAAVGAEAPAAAGVSWPVASSQAGKLTRPDLNRIIRRVEQEAARMGVLVDDMLLLARLDQQRPLEFRTVDMLAIAADALHDARVIAPERSINLTVSTPDAPLVLGEEVRLRQVVGNLMSNAMTHTPDGTPIEITIRSGTLSNGHDPAAGAGPGSGPAAARPGDAAAEPAVILEVADTGPGLSQEQTEHVFERFYRADRARTRSSGGTGLGLAIVSALVTAHHGRVWVDSSPGCGATFGFALPLAPEARPKTA
ncbi:MAG TPA: HAMP domain-containing sensor histidine kinase [Streptosporangiaceae bacterium]|nr:HAMP domain-containing sensor histidine kinase [Streptosporangiaceae bacterium]